MAAYISEISFLLFLKMDEERSELIGEPSMLPKDCRWKAIKDLQGQTLADIYGKVLDKLSRQDGLIGTIFLKAKTEIEDPSKLRRLVTLIDGEKWMGLSVDTKGAIYEGLLERNAAEVKSGAGQYFTPRPLIDAIVTVMDPQPAQTIHDPGLWDGRLLVVRMGPHEARSACGGPARSGQDAYQFFRRRYRPGRGAAVRHEPLSCMARQPPKARSSARTR